MVFGGFAVNMARRSLTRALRSGNMQDCTRRSDREAEGARLLSEYAPKGHLGFESLLLRHSDSFLISSRVC